MIIIKYLIKETLKHQISIFFILILIFFSQKAINILNLIINKHINQKIIFNILLSGIPEISQLILPLSLFFAILINYSKLYMNNEIVVMHACGLGKNILLISALILSLFSLIIALLNVSFILPFSIKYQENIMLNAKANPTFNNIIGGQFNCIKTQDIIFYISNVKNNTFSDIFITQPYLNSKNYNFFILGKFGRICIDSYGNQIIIIDKGTRYDWSILFQNFRITNFEKYKMIINFKEKKSLINKIEEKNIIELWNSLDTKSLAEFHWRLTVILSILIMTFIAVPLSEVNVREGRIISILPAMLLYLIFFLLQTILYSNVEKGNLHSILFIWLTNIFYLILGIILNFWDILAIRYFISKYNFWYYKIFN